MVRRRHVFSRPSPRTKIWIGAGGGRDTVTGTTPVLLTSLNAAALALRPFTILRTHLDVSISSDQTAASEFPHGSLARGVFSDTAVAAGIASLPDPLTDPDASWVVNQGISCQFQFVTGVGFDGNSSHHYLIDSKAMRKVGPNDDLAMIYASFVSDGATLITNGRMLVQLH